ncbi:hypothetical protein DL93DRAFT_2078084 [Clavulina sp. PMI_390]|nr:hypothetical protein DL93DRAFT_2078084 [Clavulina sp. PMI_390]
MGLSSCEKKKPESAGSRKLAADRLGLSVTSGTTARKTRSTATMKDLKSLIEKETSLPELADKKHLYRKEDLPDVQYAAQKPIKP